VLGENSEYSQPATKLGASEPENRRAIQNSVTGPRQ
jgi:hypothetical protein